MDSYSLDLREWVIQAWQDGKRQGWIADTFAVSLSAVKEWIKRFRETGSLERLARGREHPLIKDDQTRAVRPWWIACRMQRWRTIVKRGSKRRVNGSVRQPYATPCSALTVRKKKTI